MNYEIRLELFTWSTSDSNIAAAQAREIARQYGGAEMVVRNDHGDGHVTVYDGQGNITDMKGLDNEADRTLQGL